MAADAHKEPVDSKEPLFIQVWLEHQNEKATAQSTSSEQNSESCDAESTE